MAKLTLFWLIHLFLIVTFGTMHACSNMPELVSLGFAVSSVCSYIGSEGLVDLIHTCFPLVELSSAWLTLMPISQRCLASFFSRICCEIISLCLELRLRLIPNDVPVSLRGWNLTGSVGVPSIWVFTGLNRDINGNPVWEVLLLVGYGVWNLAALGYMVHVICLRSFIRMEFE